MAASYLLHARLVTQMTLPHSLAKPVRMEHINCPTATASAHLAKAALPIRTIQGKPILTSSRIILKYAHLTAILVIIELNIGYSSYNNQECLTNFELLLANVGGVNLLICIGIIVASLIIFLIITMIRKLSYSDSNSNDASEHMYLLVY
jgi:hypothetical protein